MNDESKKQIAITFIQGLRNGDRELLNAIMTSDVVWTIPGTSIASGEAFGVSGIIERAKHFAQFHLNIEILRVVFGLTGVALLLHNTGSYNGRILDEYLTTVIQLAGDKIERLDTYISDVKMLNDYFA